MARPCSVCVHPDRAGIDKALAGGEAAASIAARYRTLNRMAVQRHRADHLSADVRKAQAEADETRALDVIAQLKAINGAALSVLQTARNSGDGELVLKAVDRVHRQIELQAKLLGDLDDRPQINLLASGEWLAIRAALTAALRPYPEARVAVAGRLAQLEAHA